jgi:hypothetical protein
MVMNLLNFVSQYPDEASRKAQWNAYRDKEGVVCVRCGCKSHYWKSDKESYECKKCGYRQGLKANTVMHDSNLPFRYWFIAIHLTINDLTSDTITPLVAANVSMESVIDSDGSTSYVKLQSVVDQHHPRVIPKTEVGTVLPWVHIAISNAKQQLLNIYHHVKSKYLQSYLNEFCYKFNRRYFDEKLFDRLIIASVNYKNKFRYNYG